MKLTNGEIYNARKPLEELLKTKMPVKASFALAQLAHKLNEHLKVLGEVQKGLQRTYGVEHEKIKGHFNPPASGSEAESKYNAEIGELMAQEVEVVFAKVKLPETLEIEPSILMALDKFVTV